MVGVFVCVYASVRLCVCCQCCQLNDGGDAKAWTRVKYARAFYNRLKIILESVAPWRMLDDVNWFR